MAALPRFWKIPAVQQVTPLLPLEQSVIRGVMKDAITKFALIASATLLCGCDDIVPSAESVVQEPVVQVTADVANGDSLVCVGAIADGPCTPASAQAVISGVAKSDDISARWAGEGKVIVSVGSGTLKKSDNTAMNGKVTIQYQ